MTDRRAAIKKLALGLAGGTLAYGSLARGSTNARADTGCRAGARRTERAAAV